MLIDNQLRALGAEVVIGDLLSLNDVTSALDGIQSAYFCYPIVPRLIDATSFFAVAAAEKERGQGLLRADRGQPGPLRHL